jgi:MYXO-CTERM domain-containing protein
MHSPKVFRSLFSRISLTTVILLTAGSALGRPEVPGQLQAVADMQCVPLCTMCHSGNPGTKSNWDPGKKQLGAILSAPITSQSDIKPAYDAWAAANPTLAAGVKQGKEPSSGQDVCGPTYGCAVHVAKEAAAPRDFTGPLWAVGAMVAAGLLRRRRKPNAR